MWLQWFAAHRWALLAFEGPEAELRQLLALGEDADDLHAWRPKYDALKRFALCAEANPALGCRVL